MKRRKKNIDKIMEVLKKSKTGLTAPEVARRIKGSFSYTYELLYRLEAGKKVEREWEGAWVWRIKR